MNAHLAFLLSALFTPWFQGAAGPDPSRSTAAPALIWGDYDGDGRQDVAAVTLG